MVILFSWIYSSMEPNGIDINLPDKEFKTYVVECIYQNWILRSNQQRRITAFVATTDDLFTFDHVDVSSTGRIRFLILTPRS